MPDKMSLKNLRKKVFMRNKNDGQLSNLKKISQISLIDILHAWKTHSKKSYKTIPKKH